jgi:AmmeMemoRadiSam system protein B
MDRTQDEGADLIRPPAVAGSFYPSDALSLRLTLARLLSPRVEAQDRLQACGAIVPHAGYQYSGKTAGQVYRRLHIPPTVILLGPNHYGVGPALAICAAGRWETPLGLVRINTRLAHALIAWCPQIIDAPQAHAAEHALEVQLPFLQYLRPDVTFVPLLVGELAAAACHRLGEALAKAVASGSAPVLLLASSDMTHYEDDQRVRHKDRLAIAQMLALDPRGLLATVRQEDISMCGVHAAAVMLVAARQLGAKTARLIDYTTSAEATGDVEAVVGYAGLMVS